MALVCWSGGCDSTLMLLNLLKNSSAENPVRTISIMHDQVGAKDQQLMCRTQLWKAFKAAGYHHQRAEMEIKQEVRDFEPDQNHIDLPQPQLWLANAMLYLRKDEDMYFGYVRGDDFWHSVGWFTNAFENLKGLQKLGTGRAIFPLEWKTKVDVITELKNTPYYDMCWWCEYPRGFSMCGECHSCKRHAQSLAEVNAVTLGPR